MAATSELTQPTDVHEMSGAPLAQIESVHLHNSGEQRQGTFEQAYLGGCTLALAGREAFEQTIMSHEDEDFLLALADQQLETVKQKPTETAPSMSQKTKKVEVKEKVDSHVTAVAASEVEEAKPQLSETATVESSKEDYRDKARRLAVEKLAAQRPSETQVAVSEHPPEMLQPQYIEPVPQGIPPAIEITPMPLRSVRTPEASPEVDSAVQPAIAAVTEAARINQLREAEVISHDVVETVLGTNTERVGVEPLYSYPVEEVVAYDATASQETLSIDEANAVTETSLVDELGAEIEYSPFEEAMWASDDDAFIMGDESVEADAEYTGEVMEMAVEANTDIVIETSEVSEIGSEGEVIDAATQTLSETTGIEEQEPVVVQGEQPNMALKIETENPVLVEEVALQEKVAEVLTELANALESASAPEIIDSPREEAVAYAEDVLENEVITVASDLPPAIKVKVEELLVQLADLEVEIELPAVLRELLDVEATEQLLIILEELPAYQQYMSKRLGTNEFLYVSRQTSGLVQRTVERVHSIIGSSTLQLCGLQTSVL